MRRTTVIAVTAAALALGLTGCFGDSTPPHPLPTAAAQALTVPATLERTQPSVSIGGGMVAGSGALPYAIGGSLAAPGKAGAPAVWTSKDGDDWKRTTVGTASGTFSGELRGDATLTALGGTVWKDGVTTSRLWTSKNRRTWKSVTLPADFASTYQVDTVAVADGTVLLFGTDYTGTAGALLVHGTSTRTVALPNLPKGDQLGVVDVAGSGKRFVLIAKPGPEGEPAQAVAFRSTDGGRTWGTDSAVIADSASSISGLAWTGSGYVATGSSPETTTPGSRSLPAAWASSDGTSWSRDTLPVPPQGDPFSYDFSNASAQLGSPSAHDGAVAAVAANGNASMSAVLLRSAAGVWSWGGDTSVNENAGIGGSAVPTDGGALAVIGTAGYARAGALDGGTWSDGARFSTRDPGFVVTDGYATPSGDLITTSRLHFDVTADSWRRYSEIGLLSYTGGTSVRAADWDPPEAAGLTRASIATDESGAEVILGTVFPDAGNVVLGQGYFRPTPRAAWTPVTGFGTVGASNISDVAKTGDTWTAIGSYTDSSLAGSVDHGAVWTSPDGIDWTRASGEFGSGALESSISQVCSLPDGTPVAVGWVENATASYRSTVWVPASDGSWKRADLGPDANRYGFADSCASDAKGVVVDATIGSRSTLFRSTDGAGWKRVFRAAQGVQLDAPVAVDGGFAAAGRWHNATYSGPVVWLSADGVTWKPLTVASVDDASTTLVAAQGKDLVIGMDPADGPPLSRLANVSRVIAANAKRK